MKGEKGKAKTKRSENCHLRRGVEVDVAATAAAVVSGAELEAEVVKLEWPLGSWRRFRF